MKRLAPAVDPWLAGLKPASASEFSLRLLAEARRRGLGGAGEVVFISDGTAWAEDAATMCFPGSKSIPDFEHAGERIHELADGLGVADGKAQAEDWKEKLLVDGVGQVIVEAQAMRERGCTDPKAVEENLGRNDSVGREVIAKQMLAQAEE